MHTCIIVFALASEVFINYNEKLNFRNLVMTTQNVVYIQFLSAYVNKEGKMVQLCSGGQEVGCKSRLDWSGCTSQTLI